MSKEKKLIPKLRFPEFKNDGYWLYEELGQLSEIVRGGSPRPIQDYLTSSNDGLNWLKIADVSSDSKYITITKEKIIKEALSSTREVNPGDLILSNSMSFGRPYILKITTCIHDGWIAIRKISNKTFENYLYYFISAESSQSYFNTNAAGAAVKNLNAEIIKLLPVHFPKNKKEQEKIASCLSFLDEVITAHSQKLELLKDHKKGLMQNLFPKVGEKVPKYRFPEFKKDGEWAQKQLGEIAENLDSKRIPITSTQRDKGVVPYYGASGVIDYVREYIFNETLLCISEDGANLVDRNYPIAFSISGKTWVNNHAHVLKFESIYTQIIVENYINSINVENFLTGMAQPKLNRGKLDVIPIPLPENPKEQEKIASCLLSLDDLITAQLEKLEQLRLHKKGLIQNLFPKIDS